MPPLCKAPAGAQPVTAVTLTTVPEPDGVLITAGDTVADIKADLEIRFKGVTFTLPGENES